MLVLMGEYYLPVRVNLLLPVPWVEELFGANNLFKNLVLLK